MVFSMIGSKKIWILYVDCSNHRDCERMVGTGGISDVRKIVRNFKCFCYCHRLRYCILSFNTIITINKPAIKLHVMEGPDSQRNDVI